MHTMRALIFSVAAIWLCAAAPPAASQAYPAKPVKLILPVPTGAPPDVVGRIFARALSESLGEQVIAENRPGAGGTIGAAALAKAPPDGYTLMWAITPLLALGPELFPNAGFDPRADFTPVSLVMASRLFLVVHPSVPARTLKEFVDYAKANPNKLNFSSAGNGTVPHVAMQMFQSVAGVELVHVPFKGNHFSTLVAGEVHAVMESPVGFTQFVRADKARVLAVVSRARHPGFPDVPTATEAGLPIEADTWQGIIAPRGTSAQIIATLNAATRKATASKEVLDAFRSFGIEVTTNSPEAFKTLIDVEVDKWSRAWRASGARAN